MYRFVTLEKNLLCKLYAAHANRQNSLIEKHHVLCSVSAFLFFIFP